MIFGKGVGGMLGDFLVKIGARGVGYDRGLSIVTRS